MTKGVQILRIKTYPPPLNEEETNGRQPTTTNEKQDDTKLIDSENEHQPVYHGGDLIRGKVVIAMLDNIPQTERILEIQLLGRASAHWQEQRRHGSCRKLDHNHHRHHHHGDTPQHFSGETIIQSSSLQCVLWQSYDQEALAELQKEDEEYEKHDKSSTSQSNSNHHSSQQEAEPSLLTKSIPFEFRLKADAPGSVHLLMEQGIHIDYTITARVVEDETTVHQLVEEDKDFSITNDDDSCDETDLTHTDEESLSRKRIPLTVRFHLPQPRGNHLLVPVRVQTSTSSTSKKPTKETQVGIKKKSSTSRGSGSHHRKKAEHPAKNEKKSGKTNGTKTSAKNQKKISHQVEEDKKKSNKAKKNSKSHRKMSDKAKEDEPILVVVEEKKHEVLEPTLNTKKKEASSQDSQLTLQSLGLQLHKRAFLPGEEVSLKGSFALNHHRQEPLWIWVGVRMHLMLTGKQQQSLDRILEEEEEAGLEALGTIVEETTLAEMDKDHGENKSPQLAYPPHKRTEHHYDFILMTQKLEPQELIQLDNVRLPSTILPSLSGLAMGPNSCVKWTYELFLQADKDMPTPSPKFGQLEPSSSGVFDNLERRYTSRGNLTDDHFPEDDHHHINLFLHIPILICGDSAKGQFSTYPRTLLEETNSSTRGIGLAPQEVSSVELDNPWSIFQSSIHAKQVTSAPFTMKPTSPSGNHVSGETSISLLSPSKRLLTMSPNTKKRRKAHGRRWRSKKEIHDVPPHSKDGDSRKTRFAWLRKIAPQLHAPSKC